MSCIRSHIILITFFFALTLSGQNIFVLEKAGRMKIHHYAKNSWIKLHTISTDTTLSGKIVHISDSSLIINYGHEVLINDIASVSRERWGFNLLRRVLLTAGIAYFAISTINGAINGEDSGTFQENLIISGGLVAGGLLLTPLKERKHKMSGQRWRIKILDFTD